MIINTEYIVRKYSFSYIIQLDDVYLYYVVNPLGCNGQTITVMLVFLLLSLFSLDHLLLLAMFALHEPTG